MLKNTKIFAAMLFLLLCFGLLSSFEINTVKGDPVFGVVRIMPDGTIEGTEKIQRDGDTYTFTGDVTGHLNNTFGDLKGFLLVMKDNIVVDGAGHTLQCNGTGVGIFLRSMHNVTIKNFNLKGFAVGISSYSMDPVVPLEYPMQRGHALNNQILNNSITVNATESVTSGGLSGWGIYLEFANNTFVSGNTITTSNPQKGLYCGSGCYNTTFANNKFIGCGLRLFHVRTNSLHGNTINGKPVVHFDGVSNEVIDGAEQIFLFNCSNITIKNVHPSINQVNDIHMEETKFCEVTDCGGNIVLTNCNNNTVHDNNAKSIKLSGSNSNQVFGNTIIKSGVCIVLCGSSSYNEIYENILLNSTNSPEATSLSYSGKNTVGIKLGDVQLGGCQYNNIYSNVIINHVVGIECYTSKNNNIYLNNIADSNVGISFHGSYQNEVHQNNITECRCAVSIQGSDNTFYQNNFVDNNNQVSIRHQTLFTSDIITEYSTNNAFDSGQLLGGNFWSNYNGTDNDGDGFGDTPYIINEDTQDNYPLVAPVDLDLIPEFSSLLPLFVILISFVVVLMIYHSKLNVPIKAELK